MARRLHLSEEMSPLFERDAILLGELIDEELATIASFADGIDRCESSYLKTLLRQLRDSHTARVRILMERVEALGHRHRPAERPLSRLDGATRTPADLPRDKAVIAGMVEVEDRLQERYRTARARLSSELQHFLDGRIMTEERWTHFEVRELAHQIHPDTPHWAPPPSG